MHKDVLFRGCTRPPMILGVPYVPFLVGAGVPLLLAMYISLYILLLIPLAILVMRMMAKRDEMIFRLVGLHLVFRFLPRNAGQYGGSWAFGPAGKVGRRKLMAPYE
ncbi:VirB3 family type IV secretion system protein [Hydrogenophaga pseudoflava]|uniref:VirB3 family type IV secretion system protein n=1 Tax=Hydrogenophaga pseudoflava TaxID=47421 RepID=UPI0027E536AF|nr:VirB3 family type IV secretion system protein [Hydrogenophaga pseudoflava]MDQ7744264.1 VirB3 family type IV secretion system protein [Hydrogenophaga pseudoflava]